MDRMKLLQLLEEQAKALPKHLLATKDEIEVWCKANGLHKQLIDKDLYIHLTSDFLLMRRSLVEGKLPVRFYLAPKDFYARGIGLTSLEGFPAVVGDTLQIDTNPKLTSYKGGPKVVSGNIWANGCGFKTLKYFPGSCKRLQLDGSKLISLEGCPVCELLDVSNNKLTSLQGMPEGVVSVAAVGNPLRSFEDVPSSLKHLSVTAHGNLIKLIKARPDITYYVFERSAKLGGGSKLIEGLTDRLIAMLGMPPAEAKRELLLIQQLLVDHE